MKKFKSYAFNLTIVLCAVTILSFVAYADKGPCVWNGPEENSSVALAYDATGDLVGKTYTKVKTDKGWRCDNQNEDDCETGIDYAAVVTETTVTVYEWASGDWKEVSKTVSVTKGLEVCGSGGCR
jgi:hypothetical protein